MIFVLSSSRGSQKYIICLYSEKKIFWSAEWHAILLQSSNIEGVLARSKDGGCHGNQGPRTVSGCHGYQGPRTVSGCYGYQGPRTVR